MTQTLSHPPAPPRGDLDLSALASVFYRRRRLLLGLPLVMGLLVFALSFLLPKAYTAESLIVATPPIWSAKLQDKISITHQLPDQRGLETLALSDELIGQLLATEPAAPLRQQGLPPSELREQYLDATPIGRSHLRLAVTAADPERAAELVNLWARLAVTRLNQLFGFNEQFVARLTHDIEAARLTLDQAEDQLLAHLQEAQADSLKVRLESTRNELNEYLQRLRALRLLLTDIDAFSQRLSSQEPEQLLPGEALNLLTLQQRAVGGLDRLQVQLPASTGAEPSRPDARRALADLRKALEDQQETLNTQLPDLQNRLTSFRQQLESAEFKLDQLTQQRDLASEAYQAMLGHQKELDILLTQDDQAVRIGARALPPSQPVRPQPVVYGLLAALGTLVLTMIVVLWAHWLKRPA